MADMLSASSRVHLSSVFAVGIGNLIMQTTNIPLVLYVYRCACGHVGELHLPESAPEVTTACSACGAEVRAEWDGGVELTTKESE